jgi:hypothetical protein
VLVALRRPAPSERPFHLRQLCVKSAEAFWYSAAQSGTTLNGLRLAVGSVGLRTPIPLTPCEGHGSQFLKSEAMNTEKFADHEGWRTLWLAIAGVMAITLTWNVLILTLNDISY